MNVFRIGKLNRCTDRMGSLLTPKASYLLQECLRREGCHPDSEGVVRGKVETVARQLWALHLGAPVNILMPLLRVIHSRIARLRHFVVYTRIAM
jgi:hypothetical protein